jgi:hypothetical protein
MRKKIIIKESQYNRILKYLNENNIKNILNSVNKNDILKITTDSGEVLKLKVDSFVNNILTAKDNKGEEIIVDFSIYSETNKEIIVKKINTLTSQQLDGEKTKISNIEKQDNSTGSLDNDFEDIEFSDYYKEFLNDPNVRKAYYTAPKVWDYFVAALKNEKARGTGILPANDLLNRIFNQKINEKLPGFSDKENKRAQFYLFDNIDIPYNTITGEKNKFLELNAGYYKATVRQFETGLGDVKVLTYRASGGNFGFKIAVKKPTNDRQDEYWCDIYVYKNNVEENKYKAENIRIKFINSDGYTSYDKLEKNNK